MIAHLNGTLLFKQPNTVVVDVSGVGYEVSIPLSTLREQAVLMVEAIARGLRDS